MSSEETKRGRVRRLFIDPLTEAGMRFRHGTDPDKAKAFLDQIADDLAYMGDDALRSLYEHFLHKGEGSQKCFWPQRVTIVGMADVREPRPLQELEATSRWFASAAGTRSREAGRMASELEFWDKHKRPPVNAREWRMVEMDATDRASKVQFIQECQRDRPGRLTELHFSWLAKHEQLVARAEAMVAKGSATPGEDAA